MLQEQPKATAPYNGVYELLYNQAEDGGKQNFFQPKIPGMIVKHNSNTAKNQAVQNLGLDSTNMVQITESVLCAGPQVTVKAKAKGKEKKEGSKK